MTDIFIPDLLVVAIEAKASDLHIVAGRPPMMRINGHVVPMNETILTPDDCQEMIFGLLSDKRKAIIESDKELDFGLTIDELGRFRINVHWQKGTLSAAIRILSKKIYSFADLNLPNLVFEELAHRPQGLVLVTGPTGSGKSTTMAAIINYVNNTRRAHIITIEDPIEFIFPEDGLSLVQQREVYEDTHSFAQALKYILRQDPDVVMVGEMRDLETISSVLTAAETGHLCFSTLHTMDTGQTIDRIIDVFPSGQQEQVRVQLASVIEGVICQKLLLDSTGENRIIALEIMLATPAIRSLIRESKTHQIPTIIESNGKMGMVTMDRYIANLLRMRKITREEAMHHAIKPEYMLKLL
ncbi:MAG: type IV pilus twitching motility protein PilT [Candidatus Sumerlaeales bacterium]|nr:type IV pilus twitching motility protein PilT [Candidatus Sumerlaeales bacterium]